MSSSQYNICIECHELKRYRAKGYCTRCYNQTFAKCINRERIQLYVPKGFNLKIIDNFYYAEKNRLLEDLGKNPRKWLDSIKI